MSIGLRRLPRSLQVYRITNIIQNARCCAGARHWETLDERNGIGWLEEDRLHPLRGELRPRGADGGRRIVRIRGDKAHPISQGYVCEKSQRHGLLPERRGPAGQPDAPEAGRQLRSASTGPPPSARSPQKLAAIRAQHGGESIFYYGGGSQGNHLGGTYARQHAQGAGREVPLQCARPGEDRRGLGAGQDDGLRHPRRFRALRGGRVRRQEPVAVARLRAHAGDPARDPEGPGALADRHRSAAQRDRRDGGLPPRRAPGHRRLVPGGAGGHPRAGRPGGAGVGRRAHDGLSRRWPRRCSASPVPDYAEHLRRRRGTAAAGRPNASRAPRASR